MVIEHFLAFLKKKHKYVSRLSHLTLQMIESYMSFRLKAKVPNIGTPVKKRTVNIEVSTLKTMLNKAVKWGYLAENPLTHVDYLKENDSKKLRALTMDEVQKVLSSSPEWFCPILFTFLHTGMREGEVINLEWDDVDLENGIIKIRNKEFWKPKSSGKDIRERDIIMNSDLISFLKKHKLDNQGAFEDDFVFHNKFGEKVPPQLRKSLARITKKCGFPDVTQIHALRHTYITHLIKCSKDISVAQAQAGHADIRTTMKYADMLKEHREKAVNKLSYGKKSSNLG